MKKSGPPSPLPPAEYEAIEQAMMETSRGRWFLTEFAERNRRKDTQILLDAIAKLETSVKQPRTFENIEKIQSDLIEMSQAIQRTRSEISSLKLPEDDNNQLLGATEELDAIVGTTEKATHNILQAAEDIQETVWTLREQGGVNEAPCARIDTRVTDIYTACSFQDVTGQRTHKVVQVLRYLEARINAMISIWGIDLGESQLAPPNVHKDRPDGHLLNGPPTIHEKGLAQDDIDSVLLTTQEKIKEQNPLDYEVQQPNLVIEDTAYEIETAAHKLETLSQHTIDLAKDISRSHHTQIALSRQSGIDDSPSNLDIEISLSDSPGIDGPSNQDINDRAVHNIEQQLAGEIANISAEAVAIAQDSKDDETSAMIEEANRLTDTLRNAVQNIENLTQTPSDHLNQYSIDTNSNTSFSEAEESDVGSLANNIAHHLKDVSSHELPDLQEGSPKAVQSDPAEHNEALPAEKSIPSTPGPSDPLFDANPEVQTIYANAMNAANLETYSQVPSEAKSGANSQRLAIEADMPDLPDDFSEIMARAHQPKKFERAKRETQVSDTRSKSTTTNQASQIGLTPVHEATVENTAAVENDLSRELPPPLPDSHNLNAPSQITNKKQPEDSSDQSEDGETEAVVASAEKFADPEPHSIKTLSSLDGTVLFD